MFNLSILLEAFLATFWIMIMLATTYDISEKYKLPKWLDFKPFNCHICLFFWTSLFSCLVFFLAFGAKHYVFLSLGLILTALTTIALKVDQRKRTIDLEDIDKIIGNKEENE